MERADTLAIVLRVIRFWWSGCFPPVCIIFVPHAQILTRLRHDRPTVLTHHLYATPLCQISLLPRFGFAYAILPSIFLPPAFILALAKPGFNTPDECSSRGFIFHF
ncbi:unnamed protein product [Somion occarium]|uniref:Uncharacterized protein n=1 Tax=Somion occarium TaxID=3059160 RepID=A0ABP1CHQ2_9APHY